MTLCADIVHVTTVHPRTDTRIWEKEIAALAGHTRNQVALMVADGNGDSAGIVDIGVLRGPRVLRVLSGTLRALRGVWELRPITVHFHDPELIPLGLILRAMGYKVIYDVHEDLPRQVLNKSWIPQPFRRLAAVLAGGFEWIGGRAFTAVVAATPVIAARFPARKTVLVQNFPIIEEFTLTEEIDQEQRPRYFVYGGAITQNRGLAQMVAAINRFSEPDIRLVLAGSFRPVGLLEDLKCMPEWQRIDFKGWLGRAEIAALFGQARAGLVVLQPNRSFMDALPVKMFEYMAAGLPVIASDFPMWREIVEDAGAGVLVDSADPEAIYAAMRWILDHPVEAGLMGARGREAVRTRYNWRPEAEKLIELYAKI